ncbi:hypothetical protein M2164_001890 [Streptomyces sp. SAI-208]|uniref:hypothetical protein n=1 Tax=unclassified Streptomyces TaxID=2593676 RepID=UPI00247350B8|nr:MULTISPECIES: hypothetical protein [unclassified Streptomyces]MDH6515413.1 hypothetical protein [Streptomyces sp. SAI-090]MDH6547625.1 hypothetical protein [Streptomyces sp. SAI-041]MDH6566711.1 hypothetical protein [Streptomyces sp. SAI-117]MDH6588350.1 hypothetical protein [Streptomyces sp. SAI-133]MDH6606255.1 hypothetical protein [Streptomyces sp. SAI-208]
MQDLVDSGRGTGAADLTPAGGVACPERLGLLLGAVPDQQPPRHTHGVRHRAA